MKKQLRLTVSCCLFLVLLGAVAAEPIPVPQSEIDAENARWKSFGVTLPQGGLILNEPFEPPYSNRSFVVPPDWFWDVAHKLHYNPSFTISAADMRADLPTLHLVLGKVYAAYGSMRDRGWNWDAWFDSWDQALASKGDAQISLRVAVAPWGQAADFQPDGHFGPFIAGFHDFDTSPSVTIQLASAPAGICSTINLTRGGTSYISADPSHQPHATQQWDGTEFTPAWYVDYPSREGPASSIDCGGKLIGLKMTAQPRHGSAGPLYQIMGDGIAYLRMPFLFDGSNDQALRDTLSKAHGLGTERVLLIDLRGNGGGSVPTDILTHWFSQAEISAVKPYADSYTTDSCFKNAVMFNMFQYLTYTLRAPLDRDDQQWLQGAVDGLLKSPVDCNVTQKVTRGAPVLPQTTFSVHRQDLKRTRVIAIIDNRCESDCAAMTHLLSRLPDVVIAGTSLGPVGEGTAVPGLLVLPHTHIPYIMGTERLEGSGDIRVEVLLPTDHSQDMSSLIALAHTLEN